MTVESQQPLEERIHDPPLGLTGDERGIEGLGFSAVDEDQIGALIGRAATLDEQQRRGEEQKGSPLHRINGNAWLQGIPAANSVRLLSVVSAMLRRAWSVRNA